MLVPSFPHPSTTNFDGLGQSVKCGIFVSQKNRGEKKVSLTVERRREKAPPWPGEIIMLGGTSCLPPLEALVAAATLETIMYVLCFFI
jgi:hypothetical protein